MTIEMDVVYFRGGQTVANAPNVAHCMITSGAFVLSSVLEQENDERTLLFD